MRCDYVSRQACCAYFTFRAVDLPTATVLAVIRYEPDRNFLESSNALQADSEVLQ
jgi:hypothetical protein